MGKTSQQWWTEVKADPQLFNGWLVRQFRGESTAAKRIIDFADKHAPDVRTKHILYIIAAQESQHAAWVLELLRNRGIEPDVTGAEKRYWEETLLEIRSFQTGAAVAAHAEKMRLERIRTIATDPTAPADVKDTFTRILHDEQFHERQFREMAGAEALELTLESHRRGRKALGLEP